jgi:hypothetical protein
LEEEKKNMEKVQTKCATMIQEDITSKELETLIEKVIQVYARGKEHADKFHSLAEDVKGACTT